MIITTALCLGTCKSLFGVQGHEMFLENSFSNFQLDKRFLKYIAFSASLFMNYSKIYYVCRLI